MADVELSLLGGGSVVDKEKRKEARKNRVDKLTNAGTTVQNIQADVKSGIQQSIESQGRLQRRQKKGLGLVSELRVQADLAEAKRRQEEDIQQHRRLKSLHNEDITSTKANASIIGKWNDLKLKEIPHELEEEINQQLEECFKIIKSKDDLIMEFQRQLRLKDEEYINTLKKQSDDMEELMSTIRTEYGDLELEYDNELSLIDVSYREERDKLIEDHKAEMDKLFDTRRDNEIRYRETKQRRDEANIKEIEDLILKGSDQYSRLNIELETNIQSLKQQFEDIKATYQLNTEKLDYNYRVLTELDIEKNAELMRYKRRLTKLKDQLSKVVSDFSRIEKSDKKENAELTEDYRRLTNKYKDLQAKFRHFETADTLKYNEVWSMHEEEAKNLVDQLLRADKAITEQHLGYLWSQPDMSALALTLDSVRSGNVMWKSDGSPTVVTLSDTLVDANTTFDEDAFDEHKEGRRLVQGIRIRAVLRLLAQEVGFLLDPAVVEAIDAMPDKETELSKAENLLKALGVRTEARMAVLMKYFFKDTSSQSTSSTTTSLEEEEEREQKVKPSDELLLFNTPSEIMELRSMISAEDVVSAVKTFIVDVSDGSAVGGGTVDTGKGTEDASRIRQKRLAGMQLYWSYLSQIVGDESIGVWKQLELDSMKMKDMLIKRKLMIAQVDEANEKNANLKALLNQYLGDDKNVLFQVPPAQTMRIRDISTIRSNKKGSNRNLDVSKTMTLLDASGGSMDGGGAFESRRSVMKQMDVALERKQKINHASRGYK